MEEIKTFKKQEDGSLVITVKGGDVLNLAHDGKQVAVGTYEQDTKQIIDKANIKVLYSFIKNQYDSSVAQKETIEKELTTKLSIIDVNAIPPKVIGALSKTIDKGTKTFKESMKVLQQYIAQQTRKKQILDQLAFMNPQLVKMKADMEEIKKCL